MLPMRDVRLQLGELLVADATTLAPAVNANEMVLVTSNTPPVETLVIGDLTLATFTGSAPKGGAVGDQQAGIDPSTGEQVITILAPVGGYRWECTVAPGAPETVYGYALTDSTGATLLAYGQLATPVVITDVGDFIDLGAVEMRFVLQPLN